MKTPDQLALYADNRKAKLHAIASAEGRDPTRVGRPPLVLSEEEKEAKRMDRAKKRSATTAAWKKARRAEKALAEGRVPGQVGQPRVLTDEGRAEGRKATFRKYREANLEALRVRDVEIKRSERATPEGLAKSKAVAKSYRERHKDVVAARQRDWYLTNPECVLRYRKAHYTANKDLYYAANRRRRAAKRGAEGSHCAADIQVLRKLQKGKCAWCLKSLEAGKVHVDHYKPLARGGSDDRKNLRLLHAICNLRKHARDPIDHGLRSGLLCW